MKNINIKKHIKKFITIGALSFVLITTGCSSRENNAKPVTDTKTQLENNNEQETPNNNEETFDNFESEREELDSLIYTENFEKANDVWKDYFVDAIDFIFYGKEYKDTKFSDLNPEAQQKCLEEFNNMKNKMDTINPNWKDDLTNIKDSTVEAYDKLLNSIEGLIGTDNYNEIKEGLEGLSDIGNSLKDSANNLYQGYKNNHK